jgi:hypothetical protein
VALSHTRKLTAPSAGFFGTGAFVTGSFTPANNSLLVVRIGGITAGGGAMTAADLTIAGGGLVWTSQVASSSSPGWTYGDRIWTAEVVTGASMTITADCGAIDIFGYVVEVEELTGYNTSGFVGGTANTTDADGDGAGAVTLSATPASTSIVFGYAQPINNGGAFVTVTPGTGWTEIAENGFNDYSTMESVKNTGLTSTSQTPWLDLAATGTPGGATLLAIEIKEAGGAAATSLIIPRRMNMGALLQL